MAIFYKDDLDYSLNNNDLDETATEKITIFDKKLYKPDGSFIDSSHPDFLQNHCWLLKREIF
ncbi:MAG: hypothetical protein PVJ67_01190 [Candidatus Pacearchaeota archaeon]|jgi:hypothetical protein